MAGGERSLRLCWLYPEHMNLYGDRGNVLTFEQRCRPRGIDFQLVRLGPGERFDGAAYDLVFTGGGPDSTQVLVADDLQERKGADLRRAIEDGLPVLTVCGGYQLFARSYKASDGTVLPGIGVFDAETVHPGPAAPRCIGNIVVRWNGGALVGFENHGGRTFLGAGCASLGRVIRGHGNNARDKTEGAVYRNCYGSYIHGSLLPKNPHFADHLLSLALARKYGEGRLAPIDDALEWRAHRAALARAGA
jgi:CobQ-like glutamine amidotransferase family enzyme